ncbi:MAG: hypothetical protein IKA87_09595 [Lentisphaeria bacterium]|nr:hypothetical protein [Lentisphaeria bacterium]
MEKILRNIFLILLLLTMLLLLGSGRSAGLRTAPSEIEQTASEIVKIIPMGDRSEWSKAAKERPMWLLRIASF